MKNANDEMFEFLAQHLTKWDILWNGFKAKIFVWFYRLKKGGKQK